MIRREVLEVRGSSSHRRRRADRAPEGRRLWIGHDNRCRSRLYLRRRSPSYADDGRKVVIAKLFDCDAQCATMPRSVTFRRRNAAAQRKDLAFIAIVFKPTLRQAWPRDSPRPQYAFKISMFNVSCNSH
jgi:hypothetical protein